MKAVDLFDAALEHLRRSDEVGVAEMLKNEAVANAAQLHEQISASGEREMSAEEQVESFLQAHDEANERLLAVAFPLIEYGARLDGTLKRAIAHVVEATVEPQSGSTLRRSAAVVVVGRVLWAMATYALACGRTDALARLGSITICPQDADRKDVAVFARREFRYPHALGGSALNSFEHYQTWLAGREVVHERMSLFAAELDAAFAEADVLLALRMIATMQHRTYSGGARPDTIRRLGSRFRDRAERPGLVSLFDVADEGLDGLVESCYREYLEYDKNRLWGGLPATIVRPGTPG